MNQQRRALGDPTASGARLSQQRRRDTEPEVALRKELHRRGKRYRLHVRLLDRRRTHDIVFVRQRLVVDVRGCFWHACPLHSTAPKTNAEWWNTKLQANLDRDRRTEKDLRDAGWRVLIVWEHENPVEAAERVIAALDGRSAGVEGVDR